MITQVEFLTIRSRRPDWIIRYVQELKFLYEHPNLFRVSIETEIDNAIDVLKDVEYVSRTRRMVAYDLCSIETDAQGYTVSTIFGHKLLRVNFFESDKTEFRCINS